MTPSKRSVCLRASALAIAATGALAALSVALLPAADLSPAQPFPALLSQWSGIVLAGCGLWAWLVTIAVLVEAVDLPPDSAAPMRRPGIPGGYRRLVLAACGLVLAAGTATPALATPGPIHLDPHAAAAVPTTDAATAVARATAHVLADRHRTTALGDDIVVHRGDSLWHLAAERLAGDADDATVAHTWRRLYDANRGLIGDDPDHIEPGQRLARPEAW